MSDPLIQCAACRNWISEETLHFQRKFKNYFAYCANCIEEAIQVWVHDKLEQRKKEAKK